MCGWKLNVSNTKLLLLILEWKLRSSNEDLNSESRWLDASLTCNSLADKVEDAVRFVVKGWNESNKVKSWWRT